jgi:hypothetical protein
MHLKRKIFLRVQQLCQDRKARRVGNFSENRFSMSAPKLVQSPPAQGTFMHHALRFRSINNLPRLTDERR